MGVAVGVFGVAFGVLAVSAGVTVAQAAAMSMFTFTGASQFAAVGVLAAGGTSAAALGGALLLAARNGVYGLAVSRWLHGGLARRLAVAHLVIDETTAMAVAQPNPADASRALWITGVTVGLWWNIGTVVGAVSGQAIGDPATFGLDVAFPAAFLALLAPLVRDAPGRVAAASGAVIALVTIPFAPAGVPILAASLGVLPAWLVARGRHLPPGHGPAVQDSRPLGDEPDAGLT